MKGGSLLKGTLSTLVLKLLADNGQMYGYEVIQRIKDSSDGQMKITEGALYPSLHKLEQNGYLETERRSVSGRVRKYYSLSAKGQRAATDKILELKEFLASVQSIIQPKSI